MTVITLTHKLQSRTVFDRTFLAPTRSEPRAKRAISAAAISKASAHFIPSLLALVALISLIWIFVSGIQAIKIVFTLRNAQQQIAALKEEHEGLRLKIAQLSQPDILATYAPMLELEETTRIHYVTLQKELVAGLTEHPSRP